MIRRLRRQRGELTGTEGTIVGTGVSSGSVPVGAGELRARVGVNPRRFLLLAVQVRTSRAERSDARKVGG